MGFATAPSDFLSCPDSSLMTFDDLPVAEALLAQVCVIADERMISLNNDRGGGSSDLAPATFSAHRPADWRHYRLNLWRTVTPRAVGKHARLLVPLFLDFIRYGLLLAS